MSEELPEEANKKIGLMAKMLKPLLPKGIDMEELINQGKQGFNDFQDFKVGIELLANKVNELEDRVNKLEKNP